MSIDMEFVRKLPIPKEIREKYPLSDEWKNKKKVLIASSIILFVVIAVIYLGVSVFYQNHFLFFQ